MNIFSLAAAAKRRGDETTKKNITGMISYDKWLHHMLIRIKNI